MGSLATSTEARVASWHLAQATLFVTGLILLVIRYVEEGGKWTFRVKTAPLEPWAYFVGGSVSLTLAVYGLTFYLISDVQPPLTVYTSIGLSFYVLWQGIQVGSRWETRKILALAMLGPSRTGILSQNWETLRLSGNKIRTLKGKNVHPVEWQIDWRGRQCADITEVVRQLCEHGGVHQARAEEPGGGTIVTRVGSRIWRWFQAREPREIAAQQQSNDSNWYCINEGDSGRAGLRSIIWAASDTTDFASRATRIVTSIEAKDMQGAFGGGSNALQLCSVISVCILGRTMGTNPKAIRFRTHVGQNTVAASFVERYTLWSPRQSKTKSGLVRDIMSKRYSSISTDCVNAATELTSLLEDCDADWLCDWLTSHKEQPGPQEHVSDPKLAGMLYRASRVSMLVSLNTYQAQRIPFLCATVVEYGSTDNEDAPRSDRGLTHPPALDPSLSEDASAEWRVTLCPDPNRYPPAGLRDKVYQDCRKLAGSGYEHELRDALLLAAAYVDVPHLKLPPAIFRLLVEETTPKGFSLDHPALLVLRYDAGPGRFGPPSPRKIQLEVGNARRRVIAPTSVADSNTASAA